jgi:hypothetical protein
MIEIQYVITYAHNTLKITSAMSMKENDCHGMQFVLHSIEVLTFWAVFVTMWEMWDNEYREIDLAVN